MWLAHRQVRRSWQITPIEMMELLRDPAKSERAMKAMMQMVKLDVNEIRRAAESP